MKIGTVLRKIAVAPVIWVEKYLNFMYEGHTLLRLALNLSIAAVCFAIFVLLYQLFGR